MKTFYRFNIRMCSLFLLLFLFSASLQAQAPQHYNFNSTTPTNSFPFNIALGKEIQLLLLPGDFNQPTPAPAGNISSISFMIAANLGPYTYSDVVIKMGHTNITSFASNVWYTGALSTVYSKASVVLTGTAGQWMTIALDSPFPYDPAQSLVIDIQQCGAPGASGFSSATTALPGIRRNTSLLGTSCPFVWGQQSGTMNNIGISIAAPQICTYSWTNQFSGTPQLLRSVKAVSDMVAWAGGAAGTVRKTTDGGTTWTDGNPNQGVINGQIYNIDAIDANTAWCTTSPAAAYIYKTTNGGVNWTQVFEQTGGFINAINFRNATTGFAQGDPVASRWSLWRSTDAGSTWDSSGLYLPQTGAEAGWVNSMFQIGDIIWFGTNSTKIYKTTNSGVNWTFGTTGVLLNSFSLHYNSPTHGLGGGTSIVKTTDGGATYSDVAGAPGTGNMNGIEGRDDDYWYVRGNGVYRSTNAGLNWALVHTLTSTGNDIDFPDGITGCLTGWAVGTGGAIAKMTGTPVGITNVISEIPNTYSLEQNFPNPFNPSTNIRFSMPTPGIVKLIVYDVLGKETATILNEFRSAGNHTIEFNASALTTGVYFYKITTGSFSEIKKMILIK